MVVRGRITIDVGDVSLTGGPGHTLLLPANDPHRQRCRGSWRTFCLLVEAAAEGFEAAPLAVPADPTEAVSVWARQLCDFFASVDSSEPLLDALCSAVLTRIAELGHLAEGRRSLHPAVVDALAILRAGLDRPMDTASVAAAIGYSKSHLCRLFRSQLGCSPRRYHVGLRLDRARQLLANPYLSVSDAGGACGFNDANYFARCFRQRFGQSPTEWRRSLAWGAAADSAASQSSTPADEVHSTAVLARVG